MSLFVRETEGATSKIFIYDDKVVKKLKNGLEETIPTSLEALKRLKNEWGFPRVLDSNFNSITMTYCGEPIANLTLSEYKKLDPLGRMYSLIQTLKKHGIQHRDINQYNWLVLNGGIFLIDFSWACFDGIITEPPHGTLGMWREGDGEPDDWIHTVRCHEYFLENLK